MRVLRNSHLAVPSRTSRAHVTVATIITAVIVTVALPLCGQTPGDEAGGLPVSVDYKEPGEHAQTAPALPDFLSLLAPPPAGRNRRVSSNQQPDWNDANMDMTMMTPGDVIEVPLLEGPGMITHIWMTSHAGWVAELNSLTLRMWWDDREEPGIEVPMGMFFAQGPGMPSSVQSFPVQVSPSGSLSCYWRMPFAESARITITNDNPDRTAGLYWQIDWIELDSLPDNTPYFHARYRREYPTRPGDYELADLEGSGHYVGTVMAMTMGQDGWYGEGDDFFRIDGEAVPSHQGTGSEDYFNDAWGGRVRTTLWFGQPKWQGYRAGDTGTAYRWHLLDPIGFSESLHASIEHKGNRATSEDAWYLERPDFYSSVAFWYQTGLPKAWEPLPTWYDRRVPWQSNHLVRAFRDATVTGATQPEVTTEGFFGARPVLAWATTNPNETMTLPFSVEHAGRLAVRLIAMGLPGQGVFDIAIDGEIVLADVDFQTSETAELDILLGTHELSAGDHFIGLTSKAFAERPAAPVAVEQLRLLALPPEAVREPKLHFEAHFIRLGIGRAVYAYRLAYDRLPESLQELVDSGIMSERYLTDENFLPLVSRLEDGRFVVESNGHEPWTHSWQGLDARR
jgi:hypothetical protein